MWNACWLISKTHLLLLEHSYAYLVIYCVWLLSYYNGRIEWFC